LKGLIGGIERRTPGKTKYQRHRSTYRKRENSILNLNQRTPSIFGNQAGRDTYMMWKILYQKIMRRPFPVKEK
jgi:hypothetical protein